MKKAALLIASFLLVTGVAGAQSNAAPSLHVALAPCQLYGGSLAADSTQDIAVRGACNVSQEATAVLIAVHVSSTTSGSLKLWEYDGTQPSSSAVTFGGGTASSFADVRLCAPAGECFRDISARSTTAIDLTLVVEGYFTPPE